MFELKKVISINLATYKKCQIKKNHEFNPGNNYEI